jgi:membrane protein YqaA with SNARE-associated domain
MIIPFHLYLIQFGPLGLFIICVLSASLLPLPSEPAVVAALAVFGTPLVAAITFAGWMAGATINWFIGIKGLHRLVARDPEREEKAQNWFKKWGPPILVAGPWIPFIGDPLTLVAGTLEMPLERFLLYAAVGRIIKVLVLVALGKELLLLLGML